MREERLKHVADIRVSNVDKKTAEGDAQVRLCNYTDVYYNERITGDLDFMVATATRDQRTTFGLRQGDVVLTKDSETADDIGVSALVAEDVSDLVCGYHLAVVRAHGNRALGGYLRYALASLPTRQRMSATATGVTRFGLRSEAIADLPIPISPLATQHVIVDYLDRETARIDALIAAKRQMANLLDERFSTWRDVRLADQSVPIVPLRRFVASIGQGVSPEAEDRTAQPGEWAVLKLSAVKSGRYLPSEHKALPSTFRGRPDLVPQIGDLLITRSNTPLLVGDVCAVTAHVSQVMVCDLIYVLRLRTNLDPEYAAQALLTRRSRLQLASAARGTSQSMVKLRGEDIRAVVLPVPSLTEQEAVVRELMAERQRVDGITAVLDEQITLLQERRQALITAAVTGQLDIPEAA